MAQAVARERDEALTDRDGVAAPVPPVSEASGFLASPSAAASVEKDVGSGGSVQMRESAKTLFMEAKKRRRRRRRLGASQLSGPVTGPDAAAPPRVPSPGVAPRMPERRI